MAVDGSRAPIAQGKDTAAAVAAVICNPINVDAAALRAVIDAESHRAGWASSLWFETTVDDPGQDVTARALERDPALLIVVGGDGTIRAVTEAAHERAVPLAVVATGTGNLLARNLGLPVGDLLRSVRTAFTGTDTRIDIATAELSRVAGTTQRHVFLVMGGIGLDASMAANTNARMKRRFGWLAYTDPIAKSVFANKHITMHYRIDTDSIRTIRAHTVIVGNCGTLTANILLLPDAKIDDGLLDVVMLSPKGFTSWVRVVGRLVLHGFLHRTAPGRRALQVAPALRALNYAQAKVMHADFDTPQRIQLDGDDFGQVSSVTISVQPGKLAIRLPAER